LEYIIELDQVIFQLINGGEDIPFITNLLIICRNKLTWVPFYIFILSYILTKFRSRKWIIILGLLFTVLITDTISSKMIKKTVERERPCHVDNLNATSRIHCGQGYSFPSSHATNHFGVAIFLFLLFSFFSYRYLLFIWAGLISICQVYVGVHYPSDIIVGALLGLSIGFICYKLFDRFAFYFNKQETNINVI